MKIKRLAPRQLWGFVILFWPEVELSAGSG
jgi:hypothetical protein